MRKLLLFFFALLTGVSGVWATDVTVINSAQDATTYGTLSGTTFTTNATSGMAGVTIDGIKGTTATTFAYGACLGLISTASGTITMTAPTGYIITGYRLTARSNTYSVPYTLTPTAGGTAVTTSTDGVELTTSNLTEQTASFGYSAASANSFYIPSLVITVLQEDASLVNVTYELYESDGTTLVNSVVKGQEENSAIDIPSSLTAPTYYNYATEGTIGDSDCTIKVIRTLKSGYVISLDGLSNSKCYNIRNNRGTWAVGSGATDVNSTVELGLAFLASDTKQQFAFITYEGNVYLYSVGESKFAYVNGSKLSLTDAVTSAVEASPVTFGASTNGTYKNSAPVLVKVGGKIFGVSTGKSPDVFLYDVANDGGNASSIEEAGDFDATTALAALEDYFNGPTAFGNAIAQLEEYPYGTGLNQYSLVVEGMDYTSQTADIISGLKGQGYSAENLAVAQSLIAGTSLNIPQTNAFLRIRSSQGDLGYLTAADAGGRATFTSATDATTIYLWTSDRKLVSYGNGFAYKDMYVPTSNSTEGSVYNFIEAVSGNIGQYSLTSTYKGDEVYLYSTGSGNADRNTFADRFKQNNSFTLEDVASLPVTISAAGYATLYAPVALTIPTDVTAYVATDNGTYLTLTEVETTIPANTGVILAGSEGTYNFDITTGGSAGSNALTGTVAAISRPSDSYILSGGDSGVGFYKDGATTIPGFKAYLASGSGVKGYTLDFGTAVKAIEAATNPGKAVYDLNGRRVENPAKGLYIVNGKKVIIK